MRGMGDAAEVGEKAYEGVLIIYKQTQTAHLLQERSSAFVNAHTYIPWPIIWPWPLTETCSMAYTVQYVCVYRACSGPVPASFKTS